MKKKTILKYTCIWNNKVHYRCDSTVIKNAIFVSEKRKITLEIGHPAKNKTLK